MKKVIETGYLVELILCFLLFLFMLFDFKLDIYQREYTKDFVELENFQREVIQTADCPTGQKAVYVFQLGDVPDADTSVMFFTLHQNVTVCLDGERIYSMKPDRRNAFGKTPGCVWNTIMLSDEDSGKQMTIEIVPVYKSSNEYIPDFWYGSRYAIFKDRLMVGLPSMVIGLLAVTLGGIYIFYILYNRHNTEVDKSLLMLGMFSVQIGLWKIVDTNAFYLLFPGRSAFSYAAFLTLLLVTVPYCMFIRQLHTSSEKLIWYVPCIASLTGIVVLLVLQVFNIADLRQMLLVIHGLILFMCIVCVIMVTREILTVGWNQKLRRNMFCIGLCFVGLVLDLVIYYVTLGKLQSFLGILNFLVYNLVLGIGAIRDSKVLMAFGMQAKNLEKVAYHDQLTGLFNRMAYVDYTGSEEFDPEHCIVVVFDLNDLKKCNDTLGHEMGDKYIRESARIIRECFSDSGQCYRMGGDEFCALLRGVSLEDCKDRIKRLKEKSEQYNQKSSDILIRIACGYELYDKRLDFDINDTSSRADKMMYQEKFSMKKESGSC